MPGQYDEMLAQKDTEIERLKRLLSESRRTSLSGASHRSESPLSESDPHEPVSGMAGHGGGVTQPTERRTRRGKAPPVDSFTGEVPEIRIDEWLPLLECARSWNEWTEEELLLQLAGHLRGPARQEWGLLDADSKKSYKQAVDALRLRLDPGS